MSTGPSLGSSATAADIASQPGSWARAAKLATDPGVFADPGRIAVVGCGSSWCVATVVASLRETLGFGETDAFAASEAHLDRGYDRVVVISRSGMTTEVMQALRTVPTGTETVAIVGATPSPIADACGASVLLDFAAEASVVQTRFVTSTLMYARACFGTDADAITRDGVEALSARLPIDPIRFTHHVFLGTGWCVGLAAAAALMTCESAGLWAESHPAMEYRHGPIGAAGPSSVAWLIGAMPDGLADEVAATGATVVDSHLDPLAVLVQIQRAALELGATRGVNVDEPPNLSRAVVLEQ
jgi:fructoselysine-6-P-deglycase FrlB-like protein